MANRTYLYAADSYPGEALQDGSVCDVPVNLTGVAEWNWEIPALAETLVSANPKVCQSTIWDGPFGIVGDFDGGVARALELLQAVTHPGVSEEVSTAIRALESASTRRRYLILETAEVFALDDDPVDEQVRDLCERLAGPSGDPLDAASRINAATPADLPELVRETGLHAFWSEHLYFAPASADSQAAQTPEELPDATAEPDVAEWPDADADHGVFDQPTPADHQVKGSGRRNAKAIALIAVLLLAAILLVQRVSTFSERTGWPWWIIPAGVVAGLMTVALVLKLIDRRTPDLREVASSHRPDAPAVPGFTTAEMARWPQELPHSLALPKDAGAMVVVVSTASTYEVWTYLIKDAPTWTIRKSPQTVVLSQPGTLMGRQTGSILLSDGTHEGGDPDLNFVPSYSQNQLDDQNGSPQWITRALDELNSEAT